MEEIGDFGSWTVTQYGWVCPLCNRVYSPTTTMCSYCGNGKTSVNVKIGRTLTDAEVKDGFEINGDTFSLKVKKDE